MTNFFLKIISGFGCVCFNLCRNNIIVRYSNVDTFSHHILVIPVKYDTSVFILIH